jgi:ribosomal protein S18 acetylase RimI-like enzyme
MLIEPAEPADVPSIVAIHREALPDDVLPRLGPELLRDFYSWIVTRSDQHLAVARHGTCVEGFCLLSLSPVSVTGVLRPKHLATLARVAIRNPRLVVSALVQMTKPTVSDWEDAAEIAFIAVNPATSGQGIGRLLMEDAATVSHARGRQHIATKTANARLAQYYVRVFDARIRTHFRTAGRTYSVLEWQV